MGLNLTEGTPDDEKHNRFGKNYWDIDFYPNENLTKEEYARNFDPKETKPILGLLQIGKYRIPVTKKELEKLMETISDANRTMELSNHMGYLK